MALYHYRHGDAGRRTTEYKTWQVMRQRCFNPRDDHYKNYGGRGISVCERWRYSYENFLDDMGRKPSPGHSIDREKVDLDYTPENCHWASAEEQQNNRRNNRKFEFEGKVQTLSRWAREIGVSRPTLFSRIMEMGWSVERALSTPARGR